MEDFIYGNDPDDYRSVQDDSDFAQGKETGELHQTKINKNFIDSQDLQHNKVQDILSPTINQFTCDPIFRSMQIKL